MPRKITPFALFAVIALWAVLPLAIISVRSFAFGWYWPTLLPREWDLRAWAYITSSGVVFEALGTSAAIALIVMALSMCVGIPAARTIALHDFRWKQAALFSILLPVLAPPLASAMGVHSLFIRYGLADTVWGVILVHLIPSAPYCTLMLAGAFSQFDPAYEEVARTLGASTWSVWRYVTLPALAPGFAVAAAFAFLVSWSQYLLTLLLGGGQVRTLPLYLVAFQRSGDEAVAASLTLVFVTPALLLFAAVAKFVRDNQI